MRLDQRNATVVDPGAINILPCDVFGTVVDVSASTVEITLIDKRDEPRGFCPNNLGSQQKAIPARGFQAHTCDSYQGKLAVDQRVDAERVKNGDFQGLWFKVCMAPRGTQPGSPLHLKDCDGSVQQKFDFNPAEQIVLSSDPARCITVKDGASSP